MPMSMSNAVAPSGEVVGGVVGEVVGGLVTGVVVGGTVGCCKTGGVRCEERGV